MTHTLHERVLAFAGLCQSAQIVQQFARSGRADSASFEVLLKSLMQTDPPSTEAVYGDLAMLKPGLKAMRQQLGHKNEQRDPEITRYLIGLIVLSQRLLKRGDMQAMLGERLNQVKRQLSHFQITDDQVLANLASTYSDIISPLGSRIQVTGEARLLQQTSVQNRVRAALLCGIRSGVLWQQVGGRRLQLIFSRNKLLTHVETCLSQL